MMELYEVLEYHGKRYPAMTPVDAVKLLYQNEFAGGHMIPDGETSLVRLRQEYASVEQNSALPFAEPIGNGIVRVHLGALSQRGLSVEALNGLFVRSSNTVTGNLASFQEKLRQLCRLQKEHGLFAFSDDALKTYLKTYAKKGYPPVSHSQTYREHYAPAYRVVREDLLREYF